MRLYKFSISGYRSIVNIDSFELLDTGITTFIGGNGSGKSNLLRAIAALKGDETVPGDDDMYASNSNTETENIAIRASFSFEPIDEKLLMANQLSLKSIRGFEVVVGKKRGASATIEFSSIGYKDTKKERYEKARNDFMRLIRELQDSEETKTFKTGLLETLRAPDMVTYGEHTSEAIAALELAALKAAFPAAEQKIETAAATLRTATSDDIEDKLSKIFESLRIELLSLNSYVIENKAPVAELADGKTHAFLYDMLRLAGTPASEFTYGGAALERKLSKAANALSSAISKAWRTHEIRFEIARHAEELVFMVMTPQGQQIHLTDLSDGEQWFLKFYVRLAIAERDAKQILWLFDEPGHFLHTSSQIDLKNFFEDISKKFQIIYTSHLAMMVPWHRLERIYAVENTQTGGTQIHKRFWSDGAFKSPLKEALSTFVGEELLSGKEHVIVEGISDYFYLQAWARYSALSGKDPVGQKFEALSRTLVPVDGIEKVPLYCWFLGRKIKNSVNWIVVVDSAEESEKLTKTFGNVGLGEWASSIKSVGELAGFKKAVEIEELFKHEEYYNLFVQHYGITHADCVLPSKEELTERLKVQPRITICLEELLTEKNPHMRTSSGSQISLDKTGIAQRMYSALAGSSEHSFAKQTEERFLKALKSIDESLATHKS